ncbi:hypothetical protein EV643_11957 [Kribbella sp. VKM Ac-2527]|uniref:Uncharacterized protein n=1 Tax=Kribbella caucasensis TaxID=2512215 RepID=A0A4R6K1P8_9ACTN|nr:hypothetical protein [Kribbella sp. VKM Ac-2527]TDO43124.1 hypothetical protein EV643_11957 [Kribbella sp. VKM Ac-2527]
MNLTDLRDELNSRAADADDNTGNVLDGVHRKIRRTKQRRVATALASTAALVAVALGIVVPSLTSSTPEPSDPPPADYTKDGITIPGVVNGDRLDKAWIGKPGEDRLEFTWVPSSKQIALRSFCRSTASTPKNIQAAINGVVVLEMGCEDALPDQPTTLSPDDSLWLDVPLRRPAKVTITIVDPTTRAVGDSNSQLALGIYTSSGQTDPTTAPSREAPQSPDDYVKNGVRYRAKVGGDTLATAAVGDPGESTLRLRFTATGAPVSLRDFCTANKGDVHDPKYGLRVQFNGIERANGHCYGGSTDAGGESSYTLNDPPPAGQTVEVVATLIDNESGRPVTVPGVRLGLGVYFQGPQRAVTNPSDGKSVRLPELTEVDGYTYKLDQVKSAAATSGEVSVKTPDNRPYLILAGSTPLGGGDTLIQATVRTNSEEGSMSADSASSDGSFGVGTYPQPAGPSATATTRITSGKPTKGILVIAVYVPVE